MSFPKIKGITWMSEEFPDIVAVDVTLVNKQLQDLGDLPGLDLGEMPGKVYIDMTLLAAINPWYPKDSDTPSETECSVDVNGRANFIADVNVRDFIEAWLFCKYFKYSRK